MFLEVVFVLIGYGIGCLQSAYIVGRVFGKMDIRENGSGNAGMTNVTRVMGFKAGVFVLLLDVSKAVIAIMLANLVFNGRVYGMQGMEYMPGLLTGLGVILGHNFPFYLKFKGGKGIASTIGLAIMFDWRVLVITIIAALVVLIFIKYMSLASLVGLFVMSASTAFFFAGYTPVIIVICVISALGFFTHRKNIVRLFKGEESRFYFRKKIRP